MIETPSSSAVWYSGSVSQRLSTIARRGEKLLPDHFCQAINQASARVFAHESRIHALYTIPNLSVTKEEPDFVYTGYANALEPLLRFMVDPESRSEMYGVQVHVCMQLLVHLRRVLAILKAQGSDAHCRTYNTAVKSLVLEIERVM
ncbi:hypothetical protein BDV93DRAFT_544498 [Ceratobasidium sp. AG-I]|nr:hypothetical protein BDV93DRAFT_544498 [Ceratobasidium sp. AG-I]